MICSSCARGELQRMSVSVDGTLRLASRLLIRHQPGCLVNFPKSTFLSFDKDFFFKMNKQRCRLVALNGGCC